MKRALTEYFDPKVEILAEDAVAKLGGDKKHLHFIAEIQRADVKNRNGRVYPRRVLEREVAAFKRKIAEGVAYGEADHPARGDSSVSRTAVLWQDAWMEQDGRVMGRAKVLPTSVGKDIAAILEAGGKVGVSSRGSGSVVETTFNGEVVEMVCEDLEIKTYDVVMDPSVRTALPEKVFVESVTEKPMSFKNLAELKAANPALHEQLIREAVERAKSEIGPATDRLMATKRAALTEEILNEAKKKGAVLDETAASQFAKLRAFADTTVAVLSEAGLIPPVSASDAELVEQNRALKAEVARLSEENGKLSAALNEASDMIERSKLVESVRGEVEKDEVLRDHPFRAEIVERAIGSTKKADGVKSALTEAVAYFDGLKSRIVPTGDPAAGKGVSSFGKGDEKAPLNEAAERAKAAGSPAPSKASAVLRRFAGVAG